MDIEYRRILGGNFGDDMNSWFWEKLSPGGWNETENDEDMISTLVKYLPV